MHIRRVARPHRLSYLRGRQTRTMSTDPIPPPVPPEPDSAISTSMEASPADAETRLAALEEEARELRDKWLRAEAEMENLRTRTRREVQEARQFAVQKFATDIVEAAENLRRGLASLPEPRPGEPELLTKFRDGFEGIERQFWAILSRNGVERVDPTGQKFDADRDQAMAQQPSTEYPAGTVMQAWSSAWTLNGRLIKPAMVVVSAGADAPADPVGS